MRSEIVHFENDNPNYIFMEHEDRPPEIKEVVDKAFLYMFGYCFTLYEKSGVPFLKVQNINAIDNVLWLEFKQDSQQKVIVIVGEKEDGITAEEKVEVYDLIRRNKSLIYRALRQKVRRHRQKTVKGYERWVIRE